MKSKFKQNTHALRALCKNVFLLPILLITFSNSVAQTAEKKWNVGLNGGIIQYHGDLGRDWYQTENTMYGFGGITISRYIASFLDASVYFNRGELGYNNGEPFGPYFKSDFSNVGFDLKFNLLPAEYIVRPFAQVGVGAILFDNQLNFHDEKIDAVLPSAGGGLTFRLSPSFNITLQERFNFTNRDTRDGVEENKNDDFLMHTVGVSYNFGGKDSDKDGVSDSRDKCPDTPIGIPVDKMGCPKDSDNDGIADYLDACPNDAGTQALNGCPDKDGDGITDKDDRCPEQAGTKMLLGCPDADADGVADKDDKCPNTKSGMKVDASGCPLDSDKDGVTDDMDRCPNEAGVVALKGCPDSDGDGVADLDDRCPKTKGTIANKGCPEMAKQDITKITYIGSKIFFENNSDKLKVASLSQLDELAKILYKYEGANLTIEGHTDSNGSDALNQNLSQKRTESVKAYLVKKGIAASRLTGIGMGETKPVADNKTALGRAKNRRVELKTSY